MLTSFSISSALLCRRNVGLCTIVLLGVAVLTFDCLSEVKVDPTSPARFLWKKDVPLGPVESYSVELTVDGRGKFCFKRRDQEALTRELILNPTVTENLAGLFTRADFLNESKDFVSRRQVADMGMKTVSCEVAGRKRQVIYNYTEDKTLQEISNFFENLSTQERNLFEIDLALKYDRLGIPKKLDELEREFAAKRIVAPERFAEVLEKISQDQTLINLARKHAEKLLSKIETSSPARR